MAGEPGRGRYHLLTPSRITAPRVLVFAASVRRPDKIGRNMRRLNEEALQNSGLRTPVVEAVAGVVLMVLLLASSGIIGRLSGVKGAAPSRPMRAGVAMMFREDSALFATLIRDLEIRTDRPLRVDPRPLVGDPRLLQPSASDLAEDSEAVLQARTSVLSRLHFPRTDATADLACGVGNMRVADPAVAADTATRSACRTKGRMSSAIATLSWSGAPARFREDAAGETGVEFRTMRVFLISTDPRLGSYTAFDYVFSRTGSRPWRLLGRDLALAAG